MGRTTESTREEGGAGTELGWVLTAERTSARVIEEINLACTQIWEL